MAISTSQAIIEAVEEAEQQRPYEDRVWEVVRELGIALPPGRVTCRLRSDGTIPIFVAAADGKPVAQLELTKHDGWVLVQHRPEHLKPMVMGQNCLWWLVQEMTAMVDHECAKGLPAELPTKVIEPPTRTQGYSAPIDHDKVVRAFVDGFGGRVTGVWRGDGEYTSTTHRVLIMSRDGQREAAGVKVIEGVKSGVPSLVDLPVEGEIQVLMLSPGGAFHIVSCRQDLEHAIRLVRIWLYKEQRDFTRREVDREDHRQHERELFGGDR